MVKLFFGPERGGHRWSNPDDLKLQVVTGVVIQVVRSF
jgi:hypothetical protein